MKKIYLVVSPARLLNCEMCVIGEAVLFTGRTVLFVSMTAVLLVPVSASAQSEEVNKALARRFYEEVWFSRNPAAVDELVAPEYVIHDIGDQKAAREPASEHKRIAEVFWHNGEMSGRIDFQIAEGDLVATRWQWDYRPRSLLMRLTMIGGRNPIPIINVFRFKDGKIVEFWNHRHDIDIGFASNLVRLQGFAGGMLSSLLVAFAARIWRRRRSRTNRSVDA